MTQSVPLKKDEQAAVVYSKLLYRCVSTGTVKESIKASGNTESRNRPGVTQRVPGGLGSQISMTFGICRW
jgi:hypothetical protein